MKLSAKKNGKGYITSYSFNVGSAEARRLGFVGENGAPLQLQKLIYEERVSPNKFPPRAAPLTLAPKAARVQIETPAPGKSCGVK
jgi:hypothetical protein